MKKLLNSVSIVVVGLTLMLAGCAEPGEDEEIGNEDTEMTQDTTEGMTQDTTMKYNKAIAVLNPTQGNEAKGTVTFEKASEGVRVHAEFSQLPSGRHGFHVHLYGDCSAPDATSAGTHFNFEGSSKNPPADIDRITGNLGEVNAGQNGSATADTTITNTTIKEIIGRSVIVHERGNDPTQPPIGAAGARLGCGVIGIAESDTTMQQGGMENENM